MFRKQIFVVVLVALAGCSGDQDRDVARLDNLLIEGAKTSLNPAFDPEIFRYSIIADDLSNTLSLTTFAEQSVIISIDGRRTTSGVAESIDTLLPGDTLQIEVDRRNAPASFSAVYEVVYLPSDFPEIFTTVLEPGVSTDPLYVNLANRTSGFIAILDNYGVPYFFLKDDNPVFDFKIHEATGEHSYMRYTGELNEWARRDGEAVILDEDLEEVERVTTVGLNHTDIHDFLILPNNELLLLSYNGILRDLSSYGLTTEELVEDSVIQIIDRATRTVLFEWNSWDDIPFDDQTTEEIRGEYVHVNSAIVDTDGNLILSLRGVSQVVKVSRPGGQVLWKLGGKSNQFTFINDPFSQLCGQHKATRLENGNLLLFDNGQNCWPIDPARGDHTRIVEYRLDEQNLEAELVWSYTQEETYSRAQGSAQRLANGNTLIGWGFAPDFLVSEVSEDGTKLFELVAAEEGPQIFVYRAFRFPE